jgi:hypothetical protein
MLDGCSPNCAGKVCGDDGCGGSCGSCPASQYCDGGQCLRTCRPNPDKVTCAGKCGWVLNNCDEPVECTSLCGGCCAGKRCLPGTENDACGTGGKACHACQAGLTCGEGDSPTPGECGCKRGGPCGDQATGVCLSTVDGGYACLISNTGTTSCVGADPCGSTRSCSNSANCGCYTTVEQGGLCLEILPGYAFPGLGCATQEQRPPCDTSAECPAGSVCAPLNGLSPGTICCDDRGDNNDGKIGFCVDVQAGLCPTIAPNATQHAARKRAARRTRSH